MRKLNKLDSDGDGIRISMMNVCILPVFAAFNGCPDSDNDGILIIWINVRTSTRPKTTMVVLDRRRRRCLGYNEDKCPDIAGDAKYFDVLVDSDGDGVPDNVKIFGPEVKGLVRFKGCPDTDGDGVPDNIDKCKDVRTIEAFGCPIDTDAMAFPGS